MIDGRADLTVVEVDHGQETLPLDPLQIIDEPYAMGHEWLVTNGLGGFASSTAAFANTRRYHGVLVAALRPPVDRTLLLAKVDEQVEIGGRLLSLATNEWHDGTMSPRGYELQRRFGLDLGLPVWTFGWLGGRLEKRIWMPRHRNTTCIDYRLSEGSSAVRLRLLCLASYRDYHSLMHGAADWRFKVDVEASVLKVQAFPQATPLHVACWPAARCAPMADWYWGLCYRAERARGLDDVEDAFAVGELVVDLVPGQHVTLVASVHAEDVRQDPLPTLDEERTRRRALLTKAVPASRSRVTRRLTLAADQFIVRRGTEGEHEITVIAGYPWFSDWGRDTMISLPGLCLETGRFEDAAAILRTFARYLDQGMLPNRFPDAGEQPDYNTVDATLWYFHAVHAYTQATGDAGLVADLLPALEDAVSWHMRGTRYGIAVDPADGLLRAGVAGVQLTWMDAKIGDWVVTPRQGKPVEINALWYHALRCMASWERQHGVSAKAQEYDELANRVYRSFNARYWSEESGHLFDVIDGPNGDDPALRPNQLFAVSLPNAVLDPARWRAVIDRVEQSLLTPRGLRTLAPGSAGYAPCYEGDQRSRDSAYHQGTVWPWLLGAFVDARRRAYPGDDVASEVADSLRAQLFDVCIGSIGEVHDADPPFRPGGCVAQAWSVGEALRIARLAQATAQG